MFAQTTCLKSSHTFNVTLHTDITHLLLCPHLPRSFCPSFLPLHPYWVSNVIVKLYVLLCACVPLYIYPRLPSCKQFLWSDAAASFFICICLCQFCGSQMFLYQTWSLVSIVTTRQTVYNMVVLSLEAPLGYWRAIMKHWLQPVRHCPTPPLLGEPTKTWVETFWLVFWCN